MLNIPAPAPAPSTGSNSFHAGPDTKRIQWSEQTERLLAEWGDTAQCYKWFHNKAYLKNARIHAMISIPTIILSTFTGTFSFVQSSWSSDFQRYSPILIGTISLFVGILNTVQQFLQVSELKEAHRLSTLAWGKLYRNIELELTKLPLERMNAESFIKLNRNEYERLLETSPLISSDLVAEFKKQFHGKPGSKERAKYEMLIKPDICNSYFISINEKIDGNYTTTRDPRPMIDGSTTNPLHTVPAAVPAASIVPAAVPAASVVPAGIPAAAVPAAVPAAQEDDDGDGDEDDDDDEEDGLQVVEMV